MKKERRKIYRKKEEMSISQRLKLNRPRISRLGNAVLDFGLNKRSPLTLPTVRCITCGQSCSNTWARKSMSPGKKDKHSQFLLLIKANDHVVLLSKKPPDN